MWQLRCGEAASRARVHHQGLLGQDWVFVKGVNYMDLQNELKDLDDGRGFPYVGYKAARAALILAQEVRDLRVTLIDLSVKSDARLHQKE